MKNKFLYPITFLPCEDLQQMINFYVNILGLEIALEQGKCIIFKIGSAPHISYWGFCSHYDESLKPAQRVCLTLVVDTKSEVDNWTEKLKNQSVKCIREPEETVEFKIYNAFFEDPMGYSLEIQAFDIDGKPKWA